MLRARVGEDGRQRPFWFVRSQRGPTGITKTWSRSTCHLFTAQKFQGMVAEPAQPWQKLVSDPSRRTNGQLDSIWNHLACSSSRILSPRHDILSNKSNKSSVLEQGMRPVTFVLANSEKVNEPTCFERGLKIRMGPLNFTVASQEWGEEACVRKKTHIRALYELSIQKNSIDQSWIGCLYSIQSSQPS